MIKSTIQRHVEGFTGEEVIKAFKAALTEKDSTYQKSDIQELADAFAKSPTDNFVVYDKEDISKPIYQGDILLAHESSEFYKNVEKSFRLGSTTKSRVLQEQDGGGVTGDHSIAGISDENLKITLGQYLPPDNITRGRSMNCKIVEASKPFVLFHKEHGNIAVPAGKYMARTQINARDLTIMLD